MLAHLQPLFYFLDLRLRDGLEDAKNTGRHHARGSHGVEAITDAMRQELRPWGIEVSLVEPGAIATPIWEKSKKSCAGGAQAG